MFIPTAPETVQKFYQDSTITLKNLKHLVLLINTAKGWKGFQDISVGPFAPGFLEADFRRSASPFLHLNGTDLGLDYPLELVAAQIVLEEDILPNLSVLAHDWNAINKKPVSQFDNADIVVAMQSVASALSASIVEIDRLLLPNTAFVIDDLGIRLE